MPTLKIDFDKENVNLAQPTTINDVNTFTDLKLDFEIKEKKSMRGTFTGGGRRDVCISGDYEAISNSLYNIFSTSPGQKILTPTFGADLKRYLFMPCTVETAMVLGDVILKAIKKYEPRVDVQNVSVVADLKQQQYNIEIDIKIHTLKNKSFKFKKILSREGLESE